MNPEELRRKRLKRERRVKLLVVCGIIVSSTIILVAVPGLLISFLLAFVISYMFKPLVSAIERRGINRTLAIFIPFIISGFILSAVSGIVVNRITQQASSFQTELPMYVGGISEILKKRTHGLSQALSPFTKVDLSEKVATWIQTSSASILDRIPDWISVLLSTMLLAPFFAFFMLRDGQRISRSVLSIVPNNLFEMALNLSYQINQQLGGFIRARLVEATIVGFLVWLGLYCVGFPYASLLGLFAGMMNLIPYIGPVFGAVPALLVALVNNDSAAAVTLVMSVYVIAQLVDVLFIIPLVLARIVDLHPVTVVIVIIIGSQVMGVLGMIISVPAASILKLTFTEFYNHVVDFRA